MTRVFLATAGAFALMTSVSFAQTATTTQSTTSFSAPIVGTYQSGATQKTSTDSDGTTSQKTDTYRAGPGGAEATSSSHITTPDGSEESKSKEKHIDTTTGDTVTKKSTTTIDR